MRSLRRPVIEPQVVATGRLQPLVSENFLYVPNRTAIKQELRCRRMPEQMRRDALVEARKLPMPSERSPDIRALETPKLVARYEKRWIFVASRFEISGNPGEGAFGEEYDALLAALPDDLCLCRLEVNLPPIQ